jgi:hypothetical protein
VALLEIRTYRLKPGTRDGFMRVMRDEAVPLLRAFGIHVVSTGPSLVDEDGFEEAYLVRAFSSLAEREELEERFYGSDEWRDGPRPGIVDPIETYHTVVIEVPDAAVTALGG